VLDAASVHVRMLAGAWMGRAESVGRWTHAHAAEGAHDMKLEGVYHNGSKSVSAPSRQCCE
jgi:hypothetical protein